MDELVSVIMPAYNCEKYIAEAIKSVLNQTYQNWELIIVDDCSNDGTEEVVKSFNDSRIMFFKNEVNSGADVARNRAISAANGRWLAFLDSDDIWKPEKLEKQLEFMCSTGAEFSFTAYEQIDEYGTSTDMVCVPPETVDYKKMIRLADPIGNLTAIYDTKRVGKITVPHIKKRNDFALWLQVLKKIDIGYGMSEILASYRVRSDSLSGNKLKLIKYHWELYRKIERHSISRSIYEVMCWVWHKGILMFKRLTIRSPGQNKRTFEKVSDKEERNKVETREDTKLL